MRGDQREDERKKGREALPQVPFSPSSPLHRHGMDVATIVLIDPGSCSSFSDAFYEMCELRLRLPSFGFLNMLKRSACSRNTFFFKS